MHETLNEFVWATADRALSPIPPGSHRLCNTEISHLNRSCPPSSPLLPISVKHHQHQVFISKYISHIGA